MISAREELEARGIDTTDMDSIDVLSLNQSCKIGDSTHNFVIKAREELKARGIDTTDMDSIDVLSLNQSHRNKDRYKRGEHPMQDESKVEELRKQERDKYEAGKSSLQNFTQEETDKRNINMRLSKLNKALAQWDDSFDKFCNLIVDADKQRMYLV